MAGETPKARSGKTTTQAADALRAAVKESAQQIWLAGMGAFSKAQAEGGKVFDALVKEGVDLHRRTRGVAEEQIGEVSGRMSALAGNVTAAASQSWDKLEAIFEARTAKAMARLGVPTAQEMQALAARVDALTATVARLSKAAAPAKVGRAATAGAARAAVATPGAKHAARKKAAPPA